MNKWQRILCMALSILLLAVWMPVSLAEDGEDPAAEAAEGEVSFPDELIVGHPTITKGDVFTEMFGNDTADIDVRALIHGYNLVNWDQNQATYVFDPSVVRQAVTTVDNEGNHRYNLVLADNLYYSDGSQITAWDYAFSLLLMMSPEIEEIGGKIYRAEHILGADDYIAARRKIMAGEEPETVDYLSGVRVLSDYQIEFTLDARYLPNFFEVGLMLAVPYPIKVIAPGCKVVSGIEDEDGILGIKIVNEDGSDTPIYTAELLKKTITDPETGYNTFPSVVSGPYVITSWDRETGTGHFEINPYFKGAWMENNLPGPDGVPVANAALAKAREKGKVVTDKDENGDDILYNDEPVELVLPTIERIAFTVANNDTMMDELAAGNLHLVNKITYDETIQKGFELRNEGVAKSQNYPRIGMSFVTFDFESPAVKEIGVRQAIAWCMDRDALTTKYCGGNGLVMDGYYGLEQWEYQIVTGRLAAPVNLLSSLDELGTDIEEAEQEEYDRKRNLRFMYATSEEEKEVFLAEWQRLRERWAWKEGDEEHTLLTHYTVNLDAANELLDKYGWTLNKNGEAYKPGEDEVRCKMIDGELVSLELSMMYPEGNHMIEFMQEEGMFADNLAKAGIKLTFVPEPMESLLLAYYRESEDGRKGTDMLYMATNFHVMVDPSITYSTMSDTDVGHKIWNNTYSDDEVLYEDAVAMRKTEPGDYYEFVDKWITFQERCNTVLPTIPVYSNIYYDFWIPELQNYDITNNVTWSQAILASYFGLDEEPAEEEQAGPNEDGTMDFD